MISQVFEPLKSEDSCYRVTWCIEAMLSNDQSESRLSEWATGLRHSRTEKNQSFLPAPQGKDHYKMSTIKVYQRY